MKVKVATSVLVGLGLIACATAVAQAAPPTDACALLTPAQVSAVLGAGVGAGKLNGPHECGFGNRVLVEIIGPMGHLTPTDRFNTMKMPLPVRGVVKTPLAGVGDDAVYISNGGVPMLAVRKGAFVFTIHIYGVLAAPARAEEKALAQDVLAKL